jgi:Mn2+/Fe2+ NRAMP family transporter
LLAVVGPGLLAGLSDDDPAGITTYSVLGARYGYQLLWVLLLSTVALVVFHGLAARMGVVTGQGVIGLIRERFGLRAGTVALAGLVVANAGTTCAEYAGVAAGMSLFGIPSYVSVPMAAATISVLVLGGTFHRVEHLLTALATVFVAYVAAGLMSHPDWSAAARGLVVPSMPVDRGAVLIATATVGTTLAPWGLSFIQSYAVDKKLSVRDLGYERVDVVVGAVLTGVIGFFVVVACAATLEPRGISVASAEEAARALEPAVGSWAQTLFGIGLVGAAVLAAAILPLSTSYSICEYVGVEAAIDDSFTEAMTFHVSFLVVTGCAAAVVCLPNAPLVPILLLSQVLNAVLLLPLLVFMYRLGRDRSVMGDHVTSRRIAGTQATTIVLVAVCVGALAIGVLL